MFSLIRTILIIVFICLFIHFVRKYTYRRRVSQWYRFFLVIICILVATIFCIIPFENIFYSFKSPERVYEYIYPDSEVSLIVDGNNSSFIVGKKDTKYTHLIVPKIKSGWGVGFASEMKQINRVISDDIIISVYEYKKTGDIYISVFDVNGDFCDISDQFGTEFVCLKTENSLSRDIWVYYGYIPEYSAIDYSLHINGEYINRAGQGTVLG